MTLRAHLLSQLIPAAAERAADHPALVDGDTRLSYGELHDRVARLGGALRARGVASGDRVVVHAPKSADTFVAMHAAIHAGAIAVPVNPRSSPAVVGDVVRSVDPAAAVLHPSTAARWPDVAPVLTVGAPTPSTATHLSWDEVAETEPGSPADRTGDDPAYMITTSGSTGAPKSIVHTHRSGLRYAELASECYGLRPDDRMANVAPFHFDQSTFELYAGPLAGATVVLVPDVLLRFPANVARLVEDERITVWYSVPTILRQLLERGALSSSTLSTLRWVLFGGEIFPANELRALMGFASGARFSNVYGPAEVNQCTSHHLDDPPDDGDSIPIGTAWADTRVRVDESTDELLVHTSTAMAGYWGRPDLTAAGFLDEPAGGGFTTRWYRTGDRVEYDDAGRLHFLGRIDRQVKVRGVRVELEGVEAAFNSMPGVAASAAGLTGAGALGVILEGAGLTPDDLRSRAADLLPPGAQPDHIRVTDALPRTGSDKVDHAAAASLLHSLDTEPADTEPNDEDAT